ncbi:hypothetical protein [Brevibacillus daliensis]|uniref:hypothetical protein n=1 Tax=Brevibacillus daliensis TaxID=2892995 RepID=UPI001E462AD7|nr:hypothetical protein [Brevibacillus daliensis]
MKNFTTLRILDRFRWIFEKLGIEYEIMRKIVQLKLTMDQRRVPTVFANQTSKKTKERNVFLQSLWVYIFIGLFLSIFMGGEEYLFQMTIFFSIAMFMVMMSMISDFSSVLLDTRDNHILHTKPIHPRTISAAKIIHVTIYLFFITFSLTFIPLLVTIFNQGVLFFLVLVLELIFMNFIIILLTACFYLLVLTFFDGERLKDMIAYIQIALSIILTIGYQFVGRSFRLSNMDIVFTPEWWQFLLPPIWFGSLFEVIFQGERHLFLLIYAVMAIVMPILFIMIYVRLMPTFERSIQKLSSNNGIPRKQRNRFSNWLARRICTDREERIFYAFTLKMMKNEREFKLKVYPSLGLALIFPFIFLIPQINDGSLQEIGSGNKFLFVYFSMMMVSSILLMLGTSEKYKAAWIYTTTPIKSVASIYRGALKAALARLVLPVMCFNMLVFIVIFGMRIIPDMVVIFLHTILFTVICSTIYNREIPFSQSAETSKQSTNFGQSLLVLSIAGVFATYHYLLLKVDYAIYLNMVLMVVVNKFAWKKVFQKF